MSNNLHCLSLTLMTSVFTHIQYVLLRSLTRGATSAALTKPTVHSSDSCTLTNTSGNNRFQLHLFLWCCLLSGKIPPESTLTFIIELLEIRNGPRSHESFQEMDLNDDWKLSKHEVKTGIALFLFSKANIFDNKQMI